MPVLYKEEIKPPILTRGHAPGSGSQWRQDLPHTLKVGKFTSPIIREFYVAGNSCRSSDALVPAIRMRKPHWVPAIAWLTINVPATPPPIRICMKAVSSSAFGAPLTWNSALRASISNPVTKRARCSAWVPISATVRLAPPFSGSRRHRVSGPLSPTPIAHSWKYYHMHLLEITQVPGVDHFPGLARHGMAGVRVGDTEDDA